MTPPLNIRTVLSAAAAVVFLAGHATTVSAQSLGDVARLEAERRKQVTSGQGVHGRRFSTVLTLLIDGAADTRRACVGARWQPTR